jgi:ubiquinone/menaquinone biosynthesis C-methylase UbiE
VEPGTLLVRTPLEGRRVFDSGLGRVLLITNINVVNIARLEKTMYNYNDQQHKIGEVKVEIKWEVEEPILKLRDKWPHLYDCIDWSRISESSFRMVEELASKAPDFASVSSGGRGELYRRAQQDPSVRSIGIRRLFEFVGPNQDLASLSPGYKILDVLGGDGVLSRALKNLVLHSSMPSILTSDLSEEMVAAAQAYGLFAIRQTAQNLFLKDRCMDGVIIAYGTHHIPPNHRIQVCQEAFRVLAPAGHIVLHDFETESPMSRWFSEVVDRYSITGHQFPHFTAEEIREYLSSAGFTDISIHYMYDPFVVYADSADEAKRNLAAYLLNMYGLTKLVNEHGYEGALTLVYDLTCEYFKYDEKSPPFDEHFGHPQVYIGREEDHWYLEAPRVALVGCGIKPH